MSPEQLLLLVLVIGLPLLDRLFRAMRAPTTGSPAARVPAPAAATQPPAPRPPPPPVPTGDMHGITAEAPRPEVPREPPPRRPAPPPVRRSIPVRRDLARGDLRRAVVLMTILGPCRALDDVASRTAASGER